MSEYLKKMLEEKKSIDEVVPIDFETYYQLLKKMEKEPKPVVSKTNIPSLDNIIGGFEEGRLYILSAQTKQGKSTMAQTMMHELGKNGESSIIFSYEMGWREVSTVFGKMDKSDNVKTELPVYVPTELHRGGGELQFQWLFEAIAKAKLERNIKLVVIDHLHFLLPLKDFRNTSFLLGGIVREIKRIANITRVPIILIAHTKKIDDDRTPDWTSIRDSSFITQEADVVMMMWRIKNEEASKKITDVSTAPTYTNESMLSVELNRMGGKTGKVKLIHNGAKFRESTEMEEFTNFANSKL